MSITKDDIQPLLGEGLYQRTLRLSGQDVVWLRGLMEAYEGLGFVVGNGDGQIYIVTTADQAATLDAWLQDLSAEMEWTCVPTAITGAGPTDPTPRR